jgi:hypothetical protein
MHAEYRSYTEGSDEDGHFVYFHPLICADDTEATEKAKQLVVGHAIQLWCGVTVGEAAGAQAKMRPCAVSYFEQPVSAMAPASPRPLAGNGWCATGLNAVLWWSCVGSWDSRRFAERIVLPDGAKLTSLREKQVGDRDNLKAFANSDLAMVNEPEGVVFEYEVIGVVGDETGSGHKRHR